MRDKMVAGGFCPRALHPTGSLFHAQGRILSFYFLEGMRDEGGGGASACRRPWLRGGPARVPQLHALLTIQTASTLPSC